jgi:ABC-type Mn2+/Zn2+ transport system permease subunit
MTPFLSALIVAVAVGAACSALSVFVVSKRWAFIGEGIAHAGFGGAGTAWILGMAFPTVAWLGSDAAIYAIAVLFCTCVAFLVAALTRRARASVDTVIGIFLVASLAWGFMAYGFYAHRTGHFPPKWDEYLGFSSLRVLSPQFAALAVVISTAVLAAIALFWKELLFYATDERQAEASGVRTGAVHFGLILLVLAVIIVGMRLMGTPLIVALLVLPGATGLRIGRTTRQVWSISAATGLLGAASGPLINSRYTFIPEGPAIVLTLFLLFLISLAARRALHRA